MIDATWQEKAADDDGELEELAEESIVISHGDDGTSVSIEDPTGLEVLAIGLVGAMFLGGLWIWKRKGTTE